MQATPETTTTTVDPTEIAKFERMAAEWWDPTGKFAPLHKFGPVRLGIVRDVAAEHFTRDAKSGHPLDGLRVLDVGCGGGLLCEPLTRLGANVTGIDPSETNVEVARLHAAKSELDIDYRATTAERLGEEGETFDIVLAMEVVEHVADIDAFIASCADLVKPGGLLFVATINRTLKAFALAIVGAEYVLRWLPRGTHEYDKLVRPDELKDSFGKAGLAVTRRIGVSYNPLADRWAASKDMDVNYVMVAEKPAAIA
jgi:2-polyprenyl-6-hydroxyphenyl methylase/3-demethylubiquinone-9 3-methyltransferase